MLGRTAYAACTWVLDSKHDCSTRDEWVLMESLRRYVARSRIQSMDLCEVLNFMQGGMQYLSLRSPADDERLDAVEGNLRNILVHAATM